MSKREAIESKFEEILTPIAENNGVWIYDVEYVKEGADYYLRGYIDKEDGVTIDDCENVSRAVSEVLDQDDFIDDAYIMEISSPGLGRTLKKDRHFENSLGEEVELKTYKPIDGTKEFVGNLKAFDSENITLEIPNPKNKDAFEDRVFNRKEVSVVRLTIDF